MLKVDIVKRDVGIFSNSSNFKFGHKEIPVGVSISPEVIQTCASARVESHFQSFKVNEMQKLKIA